MLIRVMVVVGIVLVSILLFSTQMRSSKAVRTERFGTPDLPVMYIRMGDYRINPMYGYLTEIDQSTLRENLTLLAADRALRVEVDPFGYQVETISYEITSLIDGSFVENGNASNLTESEGTYTADVTITTPILMDQEYAIQFDLVYRDGEGETVTAHYYDRIVQQTGSNMEAYLAFAENFYESCLDKEAAGSIAAYMESGDAAAQNDSLGQVNIHSSMDQVTWGSLEPELLVSAIPEVREINQETASIVMNYILKTSNGEEESYYCVRDFYRMRTSQGEILLVDLARSTEQIFDAAQSVYQNDSINLGITGTAVEHMVSEKKNYAAFVSGSDLWFFGSGSKDHGTRVFSFRGNEIPNARTENRAHKIRICNVTEDGVVDFVVYGYMSAGHHEGTCGIAVYRYSEKNNVLEERLFIASGIGHSLLTSNLDKLAYCNESGQLYTYTGEQILRTDTANGDSSVIKDAVDPECFYASADQRFAAWMDEMERYASAGITVINTDSGSTRHIQANDGEKIRVLGFFNQDLVYGVARDADIVTDASGNTTFGMYKICIEGPDGSLKKEYQSEGNYVTDVRWNTDNLELNLATRTESGFEQNGNDHIINNDPIMSTRLAVEAASDKHVGQQMRLPFDVASKIRDRVRTSELMEKTGALNVTLQIPETDARRYYIYAGGELVNIERDVNAALVEADRLRGVVLDEHQRYLYERGNWRNTLTLKLNALPQGLLTPTLDAAELQNIVGEEYELLNYTGCSTESIRYQINQGYAVVARYAPDKTVLILGYDIFDNIWYYDPETLGITAIGKNDGAALFGEQGNVFMSYRLSGS